MTENKLTFLGTGTSSGVPILGCHCEVCSSADPRDKRLRTSACVLSGKGTTVLLDVGPDFRYQALKNGIERADGVLITHAHQDHIGGLDELRQLNFTMRKKIDVYGNPEALDEIRTRFDYVFKDTQEGGGKPDLDLRPAAGEITIHDIQAVPVPVMHGKIPILGYRIGDLAYITDASFISPESFKLLKGLKVLVINALRPERHPTHFSIGEAVETAVRIRAGKTYLIHLTHHFLHDRDGRALPENIHFAYDGLTISGF